MGRGEDQLGPEAGAFAEVARRYCDFIERAGDLALEQRLHEARVRLLELYLAAIPLPMVEPPDGVEAGPSPPRPENWRGFENLDSYWEVFDPYEKSDLVGFAISLDLLDVYGDVRPGLDLWDSDAPGAAAIWEWRFGFDSHWGEHAVDALRALHRACARV